MRAIAPLFLLYLNFKERRTTYGKKLKIGKRIPGQID